MVFRVCDRNRYADDDGDDFVQVKVKKELGEEKNRPTMKKESSESEIESRIWSCKRKRIASDSAGKVKLGSEGSSHWSPAMVHARRLQLSLGTKFPSAIKLLSKSHLGGRAGALVSLPQPFCRLHLPKDSTLTLEDENGEKFEVNYISQSMRLGAAGWKNFAVSHKLRERDVLVFHLVEPTKLKVYIIRADDSTLLEQDEQGSLESQDLPNQSQELVEEKSRPMMKHEGSQTITQSKLQCCKRKRATSHLYFSEGSSRSSPAIVQAHRLNLSLGTQSPSFVKLLFKSYVGGRRGAFVSLEPSFCRLHLPKDGNLTLEDEKEEKFEVKYSSQHMTFSSVGWKNFVVSHKLRERDVLVFHLVEPTKLKVYIIRGDDSSLIEQDGHGVLETPDLANKLRTFENFESKRIAPDSAGKVKLESEGSSYWSPAMYHAHCLKLRLGTQSHSFIKLMFKTHIDSRSCAFVRLPPPFCRLHLLKDATLTLEDEKEGKFEVKYSSRSMSFVSAGWKNFVVSHKLRERDVLVFHLVEPAKLKVYIIRADDSCLLEQDQQESPVANQSEVLKTVEDFESKRAKLPSAGKGKRERNPLSPAMVEANHIHFTKSLSFSEENLPAVLQARRVQLSLGNKSPSFLRLIFKSHIKGRFNFRLPSEFCREHLPEDKTIILEDENEEEYEVNYISDSTRFGAGWRNFVMSRKVRESDVLVFHLVTPTKWKVYTIRANDYINANSSPSEQNEQGIPESSQVNVNSSLVQQAARNVKPERKPISPAMVEASHSHLTKSLVFSEVNSPAMVQAHRVQLSLGNKSPSFMKLMFKSHIERRRAYVRLPLLFCKVHLLEDETITLEDEDKENFEVKYISQSMTFGAGWRNFVTSHKLRERDVLVFHLVDPTKWKVYIIRAESDDYIIANSSPSQQNEQGIPESSGRTKPSHVDVDTSLLQQIEHGGSESFVDGADESIDLGTFAEFQLKIRSTCLSELDENTMKKYYKLCSSKNDILHSKTMNLNSKLVAGIIGETVDIAAAVKACDSFTPTEKLEQWENSLRSFKLLGMKVDFLVDRVSKLLKLRVDLEGTRFADEMKNLESKRVKLMEDYEKVGFEIETLKSKSMMLGVKFQQVVDSPW